MDFLDGFIFINILEQIADFRFIIPLNSKTPKIITKSYSNVAINSSSTPAYKILDSFSDLGVPAGGKVIGLNVKGWNSGTGTFNLAKDSAGNNLILIAPNGTFGGITVEVTYV